jgi:hypothetical protein
VNEQGRQAGTCASSVCSSDVDCTNDRFCSAQDRCELRRAGSCDRGRMCPVGLNCVNGNCG